MAGQFMKSVKELSGLATAIQVFERRLEELQNHLDFVQTTLETKFNHYSSRQQSTNEFELLMAIVPQTPSHQTQILPTETETTTAMTKKIDQSQPSRRSELRYLCEMMCSRGLKKYVVTHLSDAQSLRRDAICALKSAPNPAKLVLDCVGRFFLQGSRAYTKDSPMIFSRQASVLVLEFFLKVIADSESEIEIEKSVKQEAEKDATAWRKRLISEGGVRKACEIDCRGLLLFIACFGIPKDFRNDDVRDLIRSSNLTEIGDLLKGSRTLVARIPDIIENMTNNGMHVEAVDIVYNFGIEDKFSPQKILTSFLRESKEVWKRKRRDAPLPLKEANEKHLAALKSVIKCLEERKIDPTKLLPGWQIKEKIVKLEKDTAELNKQITDDNMMPKRKAGYIESSNKLNIQETKRSRFISNGSSLMSSPSVIGLHDPRAANYADRKSSYDGLMPNLSDSGIPSYINNHFAASSASDRYNAGSLPDSIGTAVGGGGSVHGDGVEVGMSAGSGVFSTGSFAGIRGEMLVDKRQKQMYGNGLPYRWQRVGDAAFDGRVLGQSFVGQPEAMVVDSVYKPSSHFPGLLDSPSLGVGNQNSSSDLYSFADAVV